MTQPVDSDALSEHVIAALGLLLPDLIVNLIILPPPITVVVPHSMSPLIVPKRSATSVC
jgi:hypothetical protein